MLAVEQPHSSGRFHPAARGYRSTRRLRRFLKATITYALLCTASFIVLVPLIWMLSTSLKKQMDVYVFPPVWMPRPPQWQNYVTVMTTFRFPLYVLNTAFITTNIVVGTLISSSMAAYGFARLRAPGRDAIFLALLATLMLPHTVVIIPQFVLFKNLHWLDTVKPLVVPAFFGNIYRVFLLRQFLMTISAELEDAARIDGCSSLQIYYRIMLPLARPALVAVALFAFVENWNDFMGPLIYLNSESKRTIALALAFYQGSTQVGPQYHLLMAASFVAIVPCLIVFCYAQRFFVQGLVFTGVKG